MEARGITHVKKRRNQGLYMEMGNWAASTPP
jgi:hypothetical protein